MKRKLPRKAARNGDGVRKVEKIVSIPADVVLSPQAEAPRQVLGTDRSRSKTAVRELTWMRFDALIQAMAAQVRKAYLPDAVVGVAHGGVFVGGALASALRVDFFPVRISRRSRDKVVRKNPKMTGEMPPELKGKRLLVVDDIASSGDTLELARALAEKIRAKEIRTAALVRRDGGYKPDWSALVTDELVVFPWDYEEVAADGRFDVDPDKAGA